VLRSAAREKKIKIKLTLILFLYLTVDRVYVKRYLNKILDKIIMHPHLNFGYSLNKSKLNFIKFNLIYLFLIYICPYLTLFLKLMFILYHLLLTIKSFNFEKQGYNIDLAYDILRVYRFIKRPYLSSGKKDYKVAQNSWISKLFKYTIVIFIIYFLFNLNLNEGISTLLVNPLSTTDEVLELDREYERLRVEDRKNKQKMRENRLKRKRKNKKVPIRVSLEKGTTVKDLDTNKKLKLKVTGINLDQESTNYKGNIEKLFYALTRSKRFINFSKVKSVFIHFKNGGDEIPLHLGITLTNNTTFEEYYKEVYLFMKDHWKPGYLTTTSDDFIVTLYNLDIDKNIRVSSRKSSKILSKSYSTMANGNPFVQITDPHPVQNTNKKKPSIKPLKLSDVGLKTFCSMDIETLILNKDTNEHIPIAISTHSKDFSKLFLVDLEIFKKNKTKAVRMLFNEYLEFMLSLQEDYVIFAHNLGSYDGYFIYKYLVKLVKDKTDLDCLVDSSNKFITITLVNKYIGFANKEFKNKLVWKDSLRIFPGSLDSLCKQFNVEGKLSKYKEEYNSIDLFNDHILLEEFKAYSMQDSVALYNALYNAQELNYNKYRIDICDIVSTASLSLKIYRAHFLHDEIPLLTDFEEKFIRESYLGGATDYYKAKGENLHCYDVNSLYPYAMMQPVPHKVIGKHNDLSGVNVKDFKGFVLAKVTSPEYIRNPIVALKYDGRTIYPKGTWYGVYFADYLAKAQDYGYKVDLIYGIEFSYKKLFEDYIKHFYEIKKNSTGSLRYLAKLQLNSLYGMFGRKSESLEIFNIKNENIVDMFKTSVVKNIIDLNNGYSILVCENNFDYFTVKELNLKIDTKLNPIKTPTYANVAIASAITSLAQMNMMNYKNHPDFEVYYTDTDSLFTNRPIPSYLVGKELGQMKNETLDKYGVETIAAATFVGLKKYGIRVIDKDGNIRDSSTFAGVPKDTLTFDEVNSIHNGIPLVKNLKDRFSKSFNTLNIKTQTNVKLEISNKRDKELINNEYIPKTVHFSEKQDFDSKLIDKLVNRHLRMKKKYSDLTPTH
jgi:hypothetical protein